MNYNRINLICPTYGRAKTKLPNFINSAIDMADDKKQICMTFVVNAADQDSVSLINVLCKGIEYEIITENEPAPHLAKFFNMAYDQTSFVHEETIVSMVGDDMVFKSKGYDTKIIEEMNISCGMGVIYCNDCWAQGEKLCVNLFVSRALVKLTGKPFMCPEFGCDWIDNVWMEVGKKLGNLRYREDILIDHQHSRRDVPTGDATWIRSRALLKEASANKTIIPGYSDEVSETVRLRLDEMVENSGIAFIMTTFDRVPLLSKTVESYNQSFLLPKKISVFDDCSLRFKEVSDVISKMNGAEIVKSPEHIGCDNNNIRALKHGAEQENVSHVFVIDSDTEFGEYWLLKLLNLKSRFPKNRISLFDTPNFEEIDKNKDYKVKNHCGGFATLYSKYACLEMAKVPCDKRYGWDNGIPRFCDEKNVICPTKSYVQHSGCLWGQHAGHTYVDKDGKLQKSSFSENYVGNPTEDEQLIKRPESILYSCMARFGDVIAGSIVANMLIGQGIAITWMVIPRYKELVKRICPKAKIIVVEPNVGGVMGEWHEAISYKMKEDYPGYEAYINAQVGARENHDRYIRSRKHPVIWLKEMLEKKIGYKLSEEYLAYMSFNNAGIRYDIDIDGPKRPLAIIAGETQTTKSLPKEKLEEIWADLSAEGYNARILVKERPEGPWRNLRDKYIYGYNTLQCIKIIQDCDLFVGQDSGLSWASMFSKCKKRVYHNKARIEKVNTHFSVIDPKCEDIII